MTFLSLEDVTFEAGGRPALAHVTWHFARDEQWAVVGPNGAGKSLLLRGLAGGLVVREGRLRHDFLETNPRCRDSIHGVLPHGTIELVTPRAAQRLATAASPFHQVRWHASESHGRPVGELLAYASVDGINPFRVDAPAVDRAAFERAREEAIECLGIEPLLDRGALELSHGERRLVLLACALCREPQLLLLDDPMTGLDARHRRSVNALLADRVADGRKVVVATRHRDEVPEWVTHVLRLDHLHVEEGGPKEGVLSRLPAAAPIRLGAPAGRTLATGATAGECLVEMHGVHVRYGSKVILDDLDWTVRTGEHWAISGANGAGKTTLLSLILGDNPQAYANDVRLFGRPRGSGETIWDLRRRMGWMGPDLEAHFPGSASVSDVVCSGFTGTLGRPTEELPERLERARALLRLFAIEELATRALGTLPDAERRLVLIARALVLDPLVLVLDEPCQGLDGPHVAVVRDAVDAATEHGTGSVLYVTHDARDLPRSITHSLVLENGRVIRQGPLPSGPA
jgi:molybdate transport system ATP-binding protein